MPEAFRQGLESEGAAMKPGGLFHTFLRWCPGGLGLFLRQKFYPRLLGGCGRKVLFGRFIDFSHPGRIAIGNNVVVSDRVLFDCGEHTGPDPAIILEDHVFVGAQAQLRAQAGGIVIKAGSSVGSFCSIRAAGRVTVNEDVLLAAYCTAGLVPGGDNEPHGAVQRESAIDIGRGCWLGVRSAVLPGVTVGEGTVVGAHALVRDSLPSFVIAHGRPATVQRGRFEQG